ncbi:MAG: hypothetical protein EOM74_02465 [Methanomicrobia archaeon]|nr:hypothetical protein [Methanomicrobia archaeon]
MYRFLKRLHISPYLLVVLSFLSLILLGSLLLWLPFSYNSGHSPAYIDAFFTSVSAVCVTGLSVYNNIGATLSIFGKVILAILIQLGGLGFISIFTFLITLVGHKLNFSDRYIIKEALNYDSFKGVTKFVRSMVIISLIAEVLGTIPFLFVFVPEYGVFSGIGKSIFHSISSFNNAGFDLIGSSSLIPYANNILININTMVLIIAGGLGFVVISDLARKRKAKNWATLTKVVLTTTLILIVAGTLGIYLLNLGKITFLEAMFQSVTTRTAGFSTIDIKELSSPSQLLIMLLMFIGASPLSTGGGVKTTTAFIIVLTIFFFIRGKKTHAFKRTFPHRNFIQATTLVFMSVATLVIAITLLEMFEKDAPFMNTLGPDSLMFEAVSAFGTVGLSYGITPMLSTGSKIVLTVLMFFGRVGPMTMMSIVSEAMNREEKLHYQYIEANIIVG